MRRCAAAAAGEASQHSSGCQQCYHASHPLLNVLLPRTEGILFPSQLRDFLHDSLYHPSEGYFNAREPPVGVGKPLDLPSLAGEDAYRAVVRRQYDDLAARSPCRVTRPSARASRGAHKLVTGLHRSLIRSCALPLPVSTSQVALKQSRPALNPFNAKPQSASLQQGRRSQAAASRGQTGSLHCG